MRLSALPLVVHLSILFGLLTILTVGALSWLGYQRTVDLIEANGIELAEKSVSEVSQAVDSIFIPVELVTSLIGEHQVNEETTLEGRFAHLRLFERALDLRSPVEAYFIGYRNGDFFMVRRLRSEAHRRLFGVDEKVRYIVQSIDWEAGAGEGRIVQLDVDGNVLHEVAPPDYPHVFDPRVRPWYLKALAADGVARTDPYVFTTTAALGLTFAQRSSRGDAVVGADLSLESLSEVVRRQKPTASSRVVLIDHRGRVIAADDPTMLTTTGPGGEPTVVEVGAYAAEPVRVFSQMAPQESGLLRYEAGGETYLGFRRPVLMRSGDPLSLTITIPQRELLAAAHDTLGEMLLLSAAVFIAALTATLIAAWSISRSLVRLTRAANRFRQFDYATPIADSSHIAEVRALAGSFQSLQDTLNRYGNLLHLIAREKDLTSLQPTILGELSAVLEVEKAVLYVVPQQADGLVVAAHKDGERIALAQARKDSTDAVPSIVAEALAAGERQVVAGRVTAEEARLPGLADIAPVGGDFAHALCYPLRDRKNQAIGAILFLDADLAGDGARGLVGALTGIAALLLETRQLIASEKGLFNAFVALIAGAIDAKSPYTGAHCARVPELTRMLATVAVETQEGPFRDFTLSDEEWEAVDVASWLHDCGKITSPEFVIDKATKLETIYDRIHEVRMRFEVLKRDAEIERLKAVQAGADPGGALKLRDAQWRLLDEDFAFVATCNEGSEFMADEQVAKLVAIAGRTWVRTLDDTLGISHHERSRKPAPGPALPATEALLADRPDHIIPRPEQEVLGEENSWGIRMRQPEHLYNRGELHNLSVSRGTLTEEERYKINDHIIQTIIMLSALPYPRHLREVPELAGGHHERMDGTGYPRRLTREQMSPVARMMAVADIFEALTAADRPYKKGKTLSAAIGIMARMAREGHIDPDIFELFLTSGIYRDYAECYMPPEQVDEVAIEAYLPSKVA